MAGRTILIQGAGRGLGNALAARLLRDDPDCHVIATARAPEQSKPLQRLQQTHGEQRVQTVALDITSQEDIVAARRRVGEITDRLDLCIICAGLLHDDAGLWPEKNLAEIEPDNLCKSFAVNAIGPIMMIRHFHDLLTHGERAVIASLSARIGSISDNALGGWYAYRASKAAQNQFTRTASIELRRKSKALVCVGLHPGTVDTDLSAPFQARVPAKQLQSADNAARNLLKVIDNLTPEDSGLIFDWARKQILP